MARAVWSASWISNGHFAARKDAVKLGTHLTSDDAVTCAYPKAELIRAMTDEEIETLLASYKGARGEFRRSPWSHQGAALFLDDTGTAAWFDAAYCDALRLDVVYGVVPADASEPTTAFFNAVNLAEATVVIMPMRVSVDWDGVARAIAATVPAEAEPVPETLIATPEPPSSAKEAPAAADARMDEVADPARDEADRGQRNDQRPAGATFVAGTPP